RGDAPAVGEFLHRIGAGAVGRRERFAVRVEARETHAGPTFVGPGEAAENPVDVGVVPALRAQTGEGVFRPFGLGRDVALHAVIVARDRAGVVRVPGAGVAPHERLDIVGGAV